jgi:cadmium resistance protein CadD (predicted permease)
MEQSQGMIALFIPLFAIVFGVAVAIVSIVTAHREKVKRAELRHRERLSAIEKGMEPPPEPLELEGARKGASLRSGLVGLFVGVVLYFALRAVADEDVALFGLIPAAVGIANLIAWFVESRKNGNGNGLKRDA